METETLQIYSSVFVFVLFFLPFDTNLTSLASRGHTLEVILHDLLRVMPWISF